MPHLPQLPPQASVGDPVDGFWTATAPDMLPVNGWILRGVTSAAGTLRLARAATPLLCARTDVDGGMAAYDPAAGLCAARDPYPPGSYEGHDYYAGARFHYGVAIAPARAATPFDHAVVSWVAETPPGTWLQTHLRVRLATGGWTGWYALPVWASGTETIYRHSIAADANGAARDAATGDAAAGGVATVETDTLVLHHGAMAMDYQVAVTLATTGTVETVTPVLRRLSLALSRAVPDPTAPDVAPAGNPATWGRDLPVPARSQMLAIYRSSAYGGGGEVWCSPTSTAMLLAYWARVLQRRELDRGVLAAVHGVYDWTYKGTGNWPFNVAYATSFAGMDGYVARFPSLAALEPWIAARVPLALSIAFGPDTLPGAPIPSSAGHLLVLRGFDRAGNPIVNDPAAPTDAAVPRTYPRAALQRAWLSGSGGTVYVVYPQGWHVPPQPSAYS